MFGRTRWSAVGAAVAVTLGGGLAIPGANADISSGERAVFVSIVPCRLLDTRPAPQTVGPKATPLGAGETYTQPVVGTNGNCTIPTDATGLAMNVTIVNGSAASYLSVWPTDAAQPLASSLNWPVGSGAISNKVDVRLSTTGTVNFFNNDGTVDVLADVVGYYIGHDHDDRYYTKGQTDALVAASDGSLRTDQYSTYALQNFQPAHQALAPVAGNCITNWAAGGAAAATYIVPIIVPVGARLISVDAVTYDGAGAPLSVKLYRMSMTSTGQTEAALAIGGGGGGPDAVDHDVLTPAITEIVQAGEAFYVSLAGLTGGNGYCQLSVTYDTDG